MRKNILILGHSYATQFIDVFNQYTRLFDPNKYEVTVAYLLGNPDPLVKQRTMAEHVVFFNFSKNNIRYLKISAILKLLRLTREKKFEIVICHRYKPTYIMMWVAQFYKIPLLIAVMHELKTMSGLNRQLAIACLARKNMLLAGVSNAVRDDMQKNLWFSPKKQVATLYNAIDVELTEPQLLSREKARSTLAIAENTFVFGNIARLAANKDHENLIRAFAKIKPLCPQAKLFIVGDGQLETVLKTQVAKLGLQQEIIFTGFLPHAFQYMKAFDCFVLSSIQEAFGRVLLEAMLAKLPVIATRVNGIPEVLANTGVLVEARDVVSLSTALYQIYCMSTHEREREGEKAYSHVLENFSLISFTKNFWRQPSVQSILR